MIRRQYYLAKIKPFLDKGIVKAITGRYKIISLIDFLLGKYPIKS